MNDKIPLKVIGITYNQVESGVYAMILQEENGDRRIPIIIGYPEAQAIECRLQNVQTPRPLTHDMMVTTLAAFGIEIEEIVIRHLDSGMFSADVVMQSPGGEQVVIDARSSDAIALAIRTSAPIYTSEAVLSEVGFSKGKSSSSNSGLIPMPEKENQSASRYSSMTVEALKKAMDKAVAREDYEKAGELKREIDRRNSLQ